MHPCLKKHKAAASKGQVFSSISPNSTVNSCSSSSYIAMDFSRHGHHMDFTAETNQFQKQYALCSDAVRWQMLLICWTQRQIIRQQRSDTGLSNFRINFVEFELLACNTVQQLPIFTLSKLKSQLLAHTLSIILLGEVICICGRLTNANQPCHTLVFSFPLIWCTAKNTNHMGVTFLLSG